MFFDNQNDNDIIINTIINNSNNLVNPTLGLQRGNIFNNEYKAYKNIKPKELNGLTEKDNLLLKISELDFAIIDLGLYLDLNKDDEVMYNTFKSYVEKYKEYKKIYEEKYNILCQDNITNDSYVWPNKPWPVEMRGIKYV